MSAGAIAPISPVSAVGPANATTHASALAAAGLSNAQDPAIEAVKMAQQQQLFSQLMQNANSSLITQCMKTPKDDDSDDE